MKQLNTYLTFDGNCREAMKFYADCLGGELQVMSFGDMPPQEGCPNLTPEMKERTMHAAITKGPVLLMASDSMPGMPFKAGNNFSISIPCESMEEIQGLFASIGQNGKVTMPLQDTFWGAHFGMLTDQFGINWMFNFEKARQHAG